MYGTQLRVRIQQMMAQHHQDGQAAQSVQRRHVGAGGRGDLARHPNWIFGHVDIMALPMCGYKRSLRLDARC